MDPVDDMFDVVFNNGYQITNEWIAASGVIYVIQGWPSRRCCHCTTHLYHCCTTPYHTTVPLTSEPGPLSTSPSCLQGS
eukprot:2695312-Pyramimonas_sp.AAC.1